MRAKSLQLYHNSATLWTVAHLAPLSMGFSRQEHWSGLPVPPQGCLSDLGTEPVSPVAPALASRFFTTGTTWEAHKILHILYLSFHFLLSQD